MSPPFGAEHGRQARGGGMFQIRWGKLSEKAPLGWGNEPEKSHAERQARRNRVRLTVDFAHAVGSPGRLGVGPAAAVRGGLQYVAALVIGADETWWRFQRWRGTLRWWSVTRDDAVAYGDSRR